MKEIYGAIIGDIIGSRFEFNNIKSKEFELFNKHCYFTDDSVMTIAVAKALEESKINNYVDLESKLIYWMHKVGKQYPNCGYGCSFYSWIMHDCDKPYYSFGNGSGMRTSACGFIANDLDESLSLAKRCAAVSHNHPEGIKGAQAISGCIFLAKEGKTKEYIRDFSSRFYNLSFTLDEIRPFYKFDVTCQGSVPQAIESFLESNSFEDSIRNAISIGGDSDTIAAMTGGIATAYYGIPENYINECNKFLDNNLKVYIS